MKYDQFILFTASLVCTITVQAACIYPNKENTKANTDKVLSAIKTISGGVSSWIEVKPDTNTKETKNTITVQVNHTEPLKSKFSAGNKSAAIKSVCMESGGKVIAISTNKGTARISRMANLKLNKGEVPRIIVKTFIGSFQLIQRGKEVSNPLRDIMPPALQNETNTVAMF